MFHAFVLVFLSGKTARSNICKCETQTVSCVLVWPVFEPMPTANQTRFLVNKQLF